MDPNFSNFTLPLNDSVGRKTLWWFRVYCAVLCVIYLLVTGFGIFLAVAAPSSPQQSSRETFIIGILYSLVGIILFLIFAGGVLMPPRRWSWIYGMILICLGMTSCCFLPATIPLLIYWLKSETKSLFGR